MSSNILSPPQHQQQQHQQHQQHQQQQQQQLQQQQQQQRPELQARNYSDFMRSLAAKYNNTNPNE